MNGLMNGDYSLKSNINGLFEGLDWISAESVIYRAHHLKTLQVFHIRKSPHARDTVTGFTMARISEPGTPSCPWRAQHGLGAKFRKKTRTVAYRIRSCGARLAAGDTGHRLDA